VLFLATISIGNVDEHAINQSVDATPHPSGGLSIPITRTTGTLLQME
jgi:hypothetical protein